MPEFIDDWLWSIRIDPAEHGLTFLLGFLFCGALVFLGAIVLVLLA